MTTEPVIHTPTVDDLYGGIFDISAGQTANLSFDQVCAALLFYDSFIVPDGFFHCYGPIATKLSKEISKSVDQSQPNGDLIAFLRSGLIIPGVRHGQHPSDVWDLTKKKNTTDRKGVHAGEYQILRKEDGDSLFRDLRNVDMKYSAWPKDMSSGTSNSFGYLCKKYILNSDIGIPTPERAEIRFKSHESFSDSRADDADSAVRFIADFRNEVEDKYKSNDLRRGDLENFIARKIGLEEFRYEIIWKGDSFMNQTAQSIARMLSSVYEINHASNFGSGIFYVDHKDPSIVFDKGNFPSYKSGALASYTFDLMPEIDFSKITPRDLLAIRSEPYKNKFARAKALKAKATQTGSVDDIEELLVFCRNEYAPYIIALNGAAQKYPIADAVRNSLAVTSLATGVVAVGATAIQLDQGLVNFMAGGIGVGALWVADRLSTISNISGAASSASKSGLLNIRHVEWFDRYFLHDPARMASMTRFKDRLAVLDNSMRGF
jgi:hypothetical protein